MSNNGSAPALDVALPNMVVVSMRSKTLILWSFKGILTYLKRRMISSIRNVSRRQAKCSSWLLSGFCSTHAGSSFCNIKNSSKQQNIISFDFLRTTTSKLFSSFEELIMDRPSSGYESVDATICSNDSNYALGGSLVSTKTPKNEQTIKAYVDFTEFNKNYEDYLTQTNTKKLRDIDSENKSDEERFENSTSSNTSSDWEVLNTSN